MVEPDSIELIEINGDRITPSLLIWRRYKRPTKAAGDYPSVLGKFLDINPEISDHLARSPWLPIKARVRMPIYSARLQGKPLFSRQVTLTGIK